MIEYTQHPLDKHATQKVKNWLAHEHGDQFRAVVEAKAKKHQLDAVKKISEGTEPSKKLAEVEFDKARKYMECLAVMREIQLTEVLNTLTIN